jgi:hypothetical protein
VLRTTILRLRHSVRYGSYGTSSNRKTVSVKSVPVCYRYFQLKRSAAEGRQTGTFLIVRLPPRRCMACLAKESSCLSSAPVDGSLASLVGIVIDRLPHISLRLCCAYCVERDQQFRVLSWGFSSHPPAIEISTSCPAHFSPGRFGHVLRHSLHSGKLYGVVGIDWNTISEYSHAPDCVTHQSRWPWTKTTQSILAASSSAVR